MAMCMDGSGIIMREELRETGQYERIAWKGQKARVE
jgi:hypothetical protein